MKQTPEFSNNEFQVAANYRLLWKSNLSKTHTEENDTKGSNTKINSYSTLLL